MDTPTVKHYKLAHRELTAWAAIPGGEPVTSSRLDTHVIGQLVEGTTYEWLNQMAFWQYRPYMLEHSALTFPIVVRVEGFGPWKVYACECCEEGCGLICLCPPNICPGECRLVAEFRECITHDIHTAAPEGIIDEYRLAELLTGRNLDDMEYREYRSLGAVIQRSLTSPLSHRLPMSVSP